MIKNVVFDIGNVLLKFNPREYLSEKFNDENKADEIINTIFKSEEWLMLDRGTITEKDAINVLTERHKIHSESIKHAFDGWYDILTPMKETIEILNELSDKNVNIYYLSNFHHLAFEYVIVKNEFFKLFDGGIVSYKEKLLKPEKEIYLKLLEVYDLNPKETVFIDDTLANINGANLVGINTIHFNDAKNLKIKLKELKVI